MSRHKAIVSLVALVLLSAAVAGAKDHILFDSNRDGNWEIYSMWIDGTHQTRLTNHPDNDYGPTASPDGARIAFSRRLTSGDQLHIMQLDDRLLQAVDAGGGQFVWSPDGLRLVFVLHIDDNAEICVINADGTGFRQLTDNACGDFEPTWLPDCDRIGWSSGASGDADIYVMEADGTNLVQLTSEPSLELYPHWSPDGSEVVFCSDRTDLWEIYVMDADGSNVRQLTETGQFNGCPRWSPDGTQIVFQSSRDGDSEIYIMNADGSDVRQLTDNNFDDGHPSWLPSR